MIYYQYRCPAAHLSDHLFPIGKAPSIIQCPHCHVPASRLITGGSGFILSGPGFPGQDARRAKK